MKAILQLFSFTLLFPLMGLAANPAPGDVWTARDSNRNWRSVASSADGMRLVASVQNGQLYTSGDAGVTWTARESNRNWWSVASSANGSNLVAVVQGGQIYTSSDAGVTWTARDSSRNWSSVASSADASRLFAGEIDIHTSTDFGVTWVRQNFGQGSLALASSADGSKLIALPGGSQPYTSTDYGTNWTRQTAGATTGTSDLGAASSADGTRLFAAWAGTAIEVSTNSGVTWTSRGPSTRWTSIASSADGMNLLAGGVDTPLYHSTDGGLTWNARDTNRIWMSVASSADGNRLVAVTAGGQIYTSSGPIEPEIAVDLGGSAIADGGSVNFRNGVLGGAFEPEPYPQETLTIRNTGSGNLTGLGVTISGTDAAMFIVVSNATAPLAPGGSTPFTVRFVPTSGGSKTAVLHIASNDADENPYDITLNANALVPDIMMSTTLPGATQTTPLTNGASVAFPSAVVGSQVDDTNAVSFNFIGNQTGIVLSNYTISPLGQFVVVNGLPTPIALDLHNRIDVKFVPTNTGPQTATISFVSNDPDESPFLVNLTGFGQPDPGVSNGPPEIEIQAGGTNVANHSTIEFGGVPVGTNALRNLTIRNTGGSGLSITNIDIRSAVEFSIVSGQATNLPAGAEMTLGVRFTPTASGTNQTVIRVLSNDSDESSYFLNVSGNGTLPPENVEIEVRDGSTVITNGGAISFGSVNVNSATTRDLSVVNTGTTPLILAELAIHPSGFFSLSATNGVQAVPSPLGRATFARETNRAWVSIASSADGSRLLAAAGGDQSLGRLFVSADRGETWQAQAFSNHWTSVASSADGMKLVAVAGGHEKHRRIHTSTDGGGNWTARASSNWWTSVASSTNGMKLVAGAVDGIYTSADSGVTWIRRITTNSWLVASSADGSRLIAAGGQDVLTSMDFGQSWNKSAIAPQLNWLAVASSADGMKLAVSEYYGRVSVSSDGGATWSVSPLGGIINGLSWSANGNVLAASEGGGYLYISGDGGGTWTRGASDKPRVWTALALSADGSQLAATESSGQVYISRSTPVLSIAGGATATLTARFTPAIAGSQSARLSIGNNDADENLYVVNLAGSGQPDQVSQPEISIETTELQIADGDTNEFGNVTIGQSIDQLFTIRNAGTAPLNLTGMTIDGPGAASFTVVSNAVTPVAAGSDTVFVVRFAPTSPGSKDAVLHIVNNDADENPYDISLTGGGIAPVPLLQLFPTVGQSFNQFGEFQFQITGRLGFQYIIEAAGEVNAQVWFELTRITADGTVQVVEDLDSLNLDRQFYRVIEIAGP